MLSPKQYNQLSLLEQYLLRILAITGNMVCTQTSIHKCINALSLRDENGRAFKAETVRDSIDNLQNKKYITREKTNISASEEIKVVALLATLNNDDFINWNNTIEKTLPRFFSSANKKTTFFYSYQDMLHRILCLVISGEDDNDLELLVEYSQNRFYSLPHPLTILLFNPFNPELLLHITRTGSIFAANWLMKQAAFNMFPFPDFEDIFITRLRQIKEQDCKYLDAAAVSLLFAGNHEALKKISGDKSLPIPIRNQSDTVAAVSIGDTDKALKGFELWLKFIKGKSRKKNIILPDYVSFLYLLTLLKKNDLPSINRGIQYINLIDKLTNNAPLTSSRYLVLALLPCFHDLAARPLAEPLVSLRTDKNNPVLINLFIVMIIIWTEQKATAKVITDLKKIHENSTSQNNLFLSAETANLLAKAGNLKVKHKKIVKEISSATGQSCLSDSYFPIPEWQKTIRAINGLISTKNKGQTGRSSNDQRIVWLLAYNSADINEINIYPKMRVRGKNGKWSKGRAVSLKTMRERADTMDGLNDKDRLISKTVLLGHSYKYGYYRSTPTYTLPIAKILPLLVDHPNLFLSESPQTRIELVATQPQLQVTNKSDKVSLSMSPPLKGLHLHKGMALIRETPTRFNLLKLNDKQQELYQIISKDITIPREKLDQLKETIPALSSLITIESDIVPVSGDVQEKQSDPKPHLHLLPMGQGLQAEFFVRPFADAGTWYKPARGGETIFAEIDSQSVMTRRKIKKEKELVREIIDSSPVMTRLKNGASDEAFQVEDPQDCLQMLLDLKECGDKVALEWPRGEKFKMRGQVSFKNMSMGFKKERDWFQATGSLKVDDNLTLDLKQLLALLDQAQGEFIKLDDGSFLALTREFKNRLKELQAFGDHSGRGIKISPLAVPALDELTDQIDSLKTDKAWKQHVLKLREVIKAEIPSTLRAELRPYQKQGVSWLAQLAHWGVGGCLADDMGLGKTVQALAAMLLMAENGPSLVIAPVSVLANWEDEARRFAPTLRVHHFGPGDRDETLKELGAFDLVVCSYGLLPAEIDKLEKIDWQMVVLDEAQAIKNHVTKRSRAATRLNGAFKLATTGTPVENNLTELWALFRFLNPGLLGSQKSFTQRFSIPIERDQDEDARRSLRKLIRPFLLRRLKTNVLEELPPRTDVTLKIIMSKEEASLYEAFRQRAVEKLEGLGEEEKAGSRHLQILAEIMKLRRLCCNPKLVDNNSDIPSSKLKVFGDTVKELLAGNHKALVFSQFVGHLSIIREFLDKEKISYQYLDGSTSKKQRDQRVKDFQAGKGDVFLISLKAGGTGLNLTAADYVIHMDPWWNPAVEDQASDRCHRIGQERPVTVYRLVTEGTIEEQIVALHEQKRDLADSLLAGGDISGRLSGDELLTMLKEAGKVTI